MALSLDAGSVVWRLPSEFNIYQAASLASELVSALGHDLPLRCELDAVQEIDCSGLQLLLLAERESQRAGHTFSVTRHSEASREAVMVMGLPQFLEDTP